jgi:predicted metalloprotease with PDZ domain
MVVIAGGFHVRHGLGVPRKALRRAAWPYVIVLPTELSIPEALKAELTMDVDPPEIPLLAGDFAWMVPYEDVTAKKVKLGVMMRADAGAVLIDKVLPGSPAEQVGLKAGDAFVSLDDFPVKEQGDVILVIGGKKPGDWVKVLVRRDGEEMLFAPLLAVPPELPAQMPAQHPTKP